MDLRASLHAMLERKHAFARACAVPFLDVRGSHFDREDRRLLPSEFSCFVSVLGHAFDIDACANDSGDNALVTTYCSPSNSFLRHDCSGKHVWCNPPFAHAEAFLLHYLACKSKRPAHTSAVFLLPKWTNMPWWSLTHGMKLLHEYPVGSVIFYWPANKGGRETAPGIPWPVVVLYDKPQLQTDLTSTPAYTAVHQPGFAQPAACLSTFASIPTAPAHRLQVVLQGKLGGCSANILFDTGADRSYVDKVFATSSGFDSSPVDITVSLGDTSTAVCTAITKPVQLNISTFTTKGQFLILPLHNSIDVVVGRDFMHQYRCILNFCDQSVTVFKGRAKHTLIAPVARSSNLGVPAVAPAAPPVSSGVQDCEPGKLPEQDFVPVDLTTVQGADDQDCEPEDIPGVVGNFAQLSYMQVKRQLRKAPQKAFLLCIKESLQPSNAEAGLVPDQHLEALLHQYSDVLGPVPDGVPPDRTLGHCIDLVEGAVPPNLRQYRLSHNQYLELRSLVTKFLAKGWLRPSSSPFGAPILLVPKPNGTWRFCVDYRALNKLTVKNRWPLPRIDELLDKLTNARVFSALDLTSGYYQIKVHEPDIPKTAFWGHDGLYEWTVMPMGLTNAPATFQRVMHETFKDLIAEDFVCVYLDDVLVYSNTPEEHLDHLRRVLDRLQQCKLYANPEKCEFNMSELKYLGFIVGSGQLKPDPKKVQAVVDWTVPTTKHDVRSLLGLTNYFRRFINRYAHVTLPLTELLKDCYPPKLSHLWTPQCQAAFEHLKTALTSAPVLRLPDFGKPFEVVVDASDFALGAVLLQEDRPVAFESRKLIPAERNYHPGEKELLAVVFALVKFRPYLLDRHFVVYTDHRPNISLQTQVNIQSWSGRKARWAEFLQQYNFTFQYRVGSQNMADPLSRRPDLKVMLAAVTRSMLKGPVTQVCTPVGPDESPDVLAKDGPGSPSIQRQSSSAVDGGSDSDPMGPGMSEQLGASDDLLRQIASAYASDPEFLDSAEGLGYVYKHNLWWREDCVVIPNVPTLKHTIMSELHDSPYSGHVSADRTAHNIRTARLWWPRYRTEVASYVRTCDACQRAKPLTRDSKG